MKPTLTMLLAVVLIYSCATITSFRQMESHIPCPGSIGKSNSSLFKKEFAKAGEPVLRIPVGVGLSSHAFDKSTYSKYSAYLKSIGKQTEITYADSHEKKPRYFVIKITDFVGLKTQFNNDDNGPLRDYMAMDKDLKLLNEVSFVLKPNMLDGIDNAHHYYIKDSKDGLVLEAHGKLGNLQIPMSSLEVFDFDMATICWTKNQFGKYKVATFLVDGSSCPGDTEKDPGKLNNEASYLKFQP